MNTIETILTVAGVIIVLLIPVVIIVAINRGGAALRNSAARRFPKLRENYELSGVQKLGLWLLILGAIVAALKWASH